MGKNEILRKLEEHNVKLANSNEIELSLNILNFKCFIDEIPILLNEYKQRLAEFNEYKETEEYKTSINIFYENINLLFKEMEYIQVVGEKAESPIYISLGYNLYSNVKDILDNRPRCFLAGIFKFYNDIILHNYHLLKITEEEKVIFNHLIKAYNTLSPKMSKLADFYFLHTYNGEELSGLPVFMIDALKIAVKQISQELKYYISNCGKECFSKSQPQEQFQVIQNPVADAEIAQNEYLLEKQAVRKEVIRKELEKISPLKTAQGEADYSIKAQDDYIVATNTINDIKNSIPKIQECIDELEEYNKLSIEQQQNDVDFRILIFTKIKENLIYASPIVKRLYEEKANYFENLANNKEFTALIKKMNSIKDGLLDLIDFDLVDNWIKGNQEDYLHHFEKMATEFLKSELSLEALPKFLKLAKKVNDSKIRSEYDANKDVLLSFYNIETGYKNNVQLTELIDKSSDVKFFLNWQVKGVISQNEKPYTAQDAVNFFKDTNYITYKPEDEKEVFINLLEKEKYIPNQGIRWRFPKFISFINFFGAKECLKDNQQAEKLINEYDNCVKEFNIYVYEKPSGFYFKYFYDLNEAFEGYSIVNSNYKAAKEVLKQLKSSLELIKPKSQKQSVEPKLKRELKELNCEQKKELIKPLNNAMAKIDWDLISFTEQTLDDIDKAGINIDSIDELDMPQLAELAKKYSKIDDKGNIVTFIKNYVDFEGKVNYAEAIKIIKNLYWTNKLKQTKGENQEQSIISQLPKNENNSNQLIFVGLRFTIKTNTETAETYINKKKVTFQSPNTKQYKAFELILQKSIDKKKCSKIILLKKMLSDGKLKKMNNANKNKEIDEILSQLRSKFGLSANELKRENNQIWLEQFKQP